MNFGVIVTLGDQIVTDCVKSNAELAEKVHEREQLQVSVEQVVEDRIRPKLLVAVVMLRVGYTITPSQVHCKLPELTDTEVFM